MTASPSTPRRCARDPTGARRRDAFAFGETSEALFLTQGFVYNSAEVAEGRFTGEDEGFQYSRFGNPTVAMFEQRMALLEGAEAARATATGMAAVTTALMGQVRAGDHIVASRALFGSCLYIVQDLLPRFGVDSTLVDGSDLAQWKSALRPNTKTAFLESPTNPGLGVLDIPAIAEIVHSVGATLVVDNVFATPLMQKPLELGADCVVYSATKHIDGQGRCLGGIILGSKAFIEIIFIITCARPALHSHRSTPGCCSRGWRLCRCVSPSNRPAPKKSPISLPGRTISPESTIRAARIIPNMNLRAAK